MKFVYPKLLSEGPKPTKIDGSSLTVVLKGTTQEYLE